MGTGSLMLDGPALLEHLGGYLERCFFESGVFCLFGSDTLRWWEALQGCLSGHIGFVKSAKVGHGTKHCQFCPCCWTPWYIFALLLGVHRYYWPGSVVPVPLEVKHGMCSAMCVCYLGDGYTTIKVKD